MPKEYAEMATKGDPLMAFWTVATLSYLYSINPSSYKLFYLIIVIVPASIGYYELDRLVENIKKSSGKYNKGRWKNRPTGDRIIGLLKDVLSAERVVWGLFLAGINLIFGAFVYLYYLIPMIVSGDADIYLMFFFVTPLIWIPLVFWRLSRIG